MWTQQYTRCLFSHFFAASRGVRLIASLLLKESVFSVPGPPSGLKTVAIQRKISLFISLLVIKAGVYVCKTGIARGSLLGAVNYEIAV